MSGIPVRASAPAPAPLPMADPGMATASGVVDDGPAPPARCGADLGTVSDVELTRRSGPSGAVRRYASVVAAAASVALVSAGCSSPAKVVAPSTTTVPAAAAQLDRCRASALGHATVFQADIDDCEAAFSQRYQTLDCPVGPSGIIVEVDAAYFALVAGGHSIPLGAAPPSPVDPGLCS